MKHTLHISQIGMTLVELMIAMGVASVVLTGAVLIYLTCTKITSGGMAQLAVQMKARNALDAIQYDVKRSQRAVIYPSYLGSSTFTGPPSTTSGAYIIFQLPTNTLNGPLDQPFHHYYVGNLKSIGNGVTNGTLYSFNCASDTNLTTKSPDVQLIQGVTNPDLVFDWINGVININIRVADENDVDGKQVIYLRSAVAFRNGS